MISPDRTLIFASTAPHCGATTKDYIKAKRDFHKEIYTVERTNKAGVRTEEQNEKAESCWENLWNEIYLKGS